MKKLYFATGNENKFLEVQKILKSRFEVGWEKSLDISEIQDTSVTIVANQKAEDAYEILGKRPVLVEDTGLIILAWGLLPGALIKYEMKQPRPLEKILTKLSGFSNDCRHAEAQAAFAYCDENGVQTFFGSIMGEIAKKPRGDPSFGWDPIFIPSGHTKTFAEMTPEEKNKISHRRRALDNLKENIET